MKGRNEKGFRCFCPEKVPSLAISACLGYMSMDRQAESFVCLGLIVILLQNTGRSQAECSKRFSDAPGQIADSLHKDNQGSHSAAACRYRICAPPDHYIILNITQLEGIPLPVGHGCIPRLVVKNVGSAGSLSHLTTLCNGEQPLPRVVQSRDNELRLIFRSQVWQSSTFQATFTFHKKTEPQSCIACSLVKELNKSMNTSFPSLAPNNSGHIHSNEPTGPQDSESGAWHMEYFVLVILAPLTLVCLCCVTIMFYRRRQNIFTSHPPSLQTPGYTISSDSPPASQSPLIPSDRFSAQHQQAMLRQQRERVCPHSESTEKFPTSVCLFDEDEPQHMRENVRIHRDVMGENGIRAPPNRTVFDSEMQDMMIQCSRKTDSQRHSVQRSPSSATSRGNHGATLQGGGGGEVIDSETRSPINFKDSDTEGPPPYASVVQINNNIINVCDDSTVSTSSSMDGLLQSQQQQQQQHQQSCSPCQPNSIGRFHTSSRGVGRGSGVKLKPDGGDCV